MTNSFYARHSHHVVIGLIVSTIIIIALVVYLLDRMKHRPLPSFFAVQANGQRMELQSHEEPNLLPDTILQWASKAATIATTYSFSEYTSQLAAAQPYFTSAGWRNYLQSVERLISGIRTNQLIVNSVVTGTPVISNQGPLPGLDYAWQVQIPFLVAYQPATGVPYQRSYYVVLTIARVPTSRHPQGIGIDQFVME